MNPQNEPSTPPPDAALHNESNADAEVNLDPAATSDSHHLPPTENATFHISTGTVLADKYRLTQRIGEGGMGSIWVAQQSTPIKRQVAIKLIKAGMDSRQVLARFDAERQALAMMDHPNIAKVFDGGVTPNGHPFFAMELVKGVPITEFCDSRKLTPKERLELFIPVCHAIQHAHQKGVIHRDIKPSNVLVALFDDRPVPKVIDFGVAKATGQALTDHSLHTGFGGVVGTPDYMSPEQATMNNLDIDTRSDVYSLGALLYELLTGSPPFSRKELERRGMLEMLRVVREEDPPHPSTKISTADALPTLSANRATEPKKLASLLRNELDWIVMKSLEKDRTRRYETANGFAADVLRYLSGEPVAAHPPSVAYRFRKFVRRHQGQVVAASIVLLTLVLGITGTTIGLLQARAAWTSEALRANSERDAKDSESMARKKAVEASAIAEEQKNLAIVQKNDAIKQKQAATAAKEFLQSILQQGSAEGQASANRVANPNITLREALDFAAEQVGEAFTSQPEIEADLRDTIGLAYLQMAVYPEAETQLKTALEIRQKALGPTHQDSLVSASTLAELYMTRGNFPDAEKLLLQTLEAREKTLGPTHPDTLESVSALATFYWDIGNYEEAEPLRKRSMASREQVLGPDHQDTLLAVADLGRLYWAMGKYADAEPLLRKALDGREKTLGPDHPDTLRSVQHLGELYRAKEDFVSAEPLFQRAFIGREKILGPDHPITLNSVSALAALQVAKADYVAAEIMFKRVLEGYEKLHGPEHPHTLTSVNNLASVYVAMGKLEAAEPLFKRALEGKEKTLGADHPDTLKSINGLASLYHRTKRLDLSIPMFEDAIKRARPKLGDAHPTTLLAAANLGVNYRDAGRFEEAIVRMEQAFAAAKELPQLAWVGKELALTYLKSRERPEAIRLVEQQIVEARTRIPPNSSELGELLTTYGKVFFDFDEYGEAEKLLRESLSLRETLGADIWTTYSTKALLGQTLVGLKRYSDAEPLLLAGYDGMERHEAIIPKTVQSQLPETLDRMIEMYTALNNPEQVKKWQTERSKYDGK